MDFFEHQDVARRNTGRLIFLFLAAVAGIVVMVYGLVIAVFVFRVENRITSLWQPQIFLNTTIGVLAVITAGSVWKIKQLGKGGAAIAERIGGRRLDPASTDPLDRRVLNLVEEMAIASGTPVPPVFMLDQERSINAFAAGRHPSDAVIGVTRGAVTVLNRDELQGVIAHEFSHVFHGDSELNLQLIGIIHGIELIGLAGRMMLHGTGRRAARGKKGGAPIAVGAALMLIGAIGSLFGNLIRSAVSKQREFLADASAVQFTRNAGGIAGALRKIGGYGFGSHLGHPARAEMSHMFFGSGLPAWDLGQMFSTHPRIDERIRRVDPSFDGEIPTVPVEFVSRWSGDAAVAAAAPEPGRAERVASPDEVREAVSQFTASALRKPGSAAASAAMAGLAALGALGRDEIAVFGAGSVARQPLEGGRARPKPLLERLGDPGPEHLAYAEALVSSLPAALKDAAHDRDGARALCYAMLGGDEASVRAAQEGRVARLEGPAMADRMRALRGELEETGPEARIPLSEMVAGTLKGLEPATYGSFRKIAHELVEEDGRVDLAEWVLAGLLLHRLDAHFTPKRTRPYRYSRFQGLSNELIYLMSALAHAANADPARARQAFDDGARALDLRGVQPIAPELCTPRVVEAALDTLNELAPRLKKRLLGACAASIAADETITPAEAELFRVVADWLDCPAPPLLPGQQLA